jgi:hypothetical protein
LDIPVQGPYKPVCSCFFLIWSLLTVHCAVSLSLLKKHVYKYPVTHRRPQRALANQTGEWDLSTSLWVDVGSVGVI